MVKIRKNSISNLLIPDILNLETFGWESEFYKRQPNKISSSALFMSFWEMHQNGKNTLKNWSTNLSKLIDKTVTEQSLNERINERTVKLSKMALEHALNLRGTKTALKKKRKN